MVFCRRPLVVTVLYGRRMDYGPRSRTVGGPNRNYMTIFRLMFMGTPWEV